MSKRVRLLRRRRVNPGDELIAIDGLRVGSGQFEERLKDYQPGDTIELTTFHGDELKLRSLTLAQPRATNYSIDIIENPSSIQQQNFEQWLESLVVFSLPLKLVAKEKKSCLQLHLKKIPNSSLRN